MWRLLSKHACGCKCTGVGEQKIKYTGYKNVWLWRKSRKAIWCVCCQVVKCRRWSVTYSDQGRHYREGDTLGNSPKRWRNKPVAIYGRILEAEGRVGTKALRMRYTWPLIFLQWIKQGQKHKVWDISVWGNCINCEACRTWWELGFYSAIKRIFKIFKKRNLCISYGLFTKLFLNNKGIQRLKFYVSANVSAFN